MAKIKKVLPSKESRHYNPDNGKSVYLGIIIRYSKQKVNTWILRSNKKQEQPIGGSHQLPQAVPIDYDDRCFRKLYKAKDKDIDLEGWDSLVADEFDRSDYDTIICSKAAASASS